MSGLLTISVGTAVAKAVFKSWFKDNEFAASFSESISDLVGTTIKDRRSKSAAERQFSRIAECAAEALQPLIDAEWRGLPESEIIAATHELSIAINKTQINARLLASINNSPDLLSSAIKKNGNTRLLSTPAAELYGRLLNEASQLVVDLAENLPSFTTENFSEVLKREQIIIEKVDLIFEEFSNIRAQSSALNPETASRLFEESYRHAVARTLDEIELFGLDTDSNSSSRRHNLTTAYISLSVAQREKESSKSAEKRKAGLTTKTRARSNQTSSSTAIRVDEAIKLSPRLVVRGEAGSGKTTLLQYIAVRCATARFSGEMSEWNELIPFFIRLRAINSPDMPTPEQFPGLVAPMIAGTMPTSWSHNHLQNGRAIILIDGLDEVSEERRDSIRRWLKDLTGSFPDCRYIITSRPGAIPLNWLGGEKFTEIDLLPMTPSDVDEFIDHWHDAVYKAESELARREEIGSLAPDMKQRVRSDRSLRELASSPLLCAMLCAMHRDKKRALPSNRISLYESAISMIVDKRDRQRKVIVGDIPDVELDIKMSLLQEIAFWMMENGWSMVDKWRAEERISSLLPRFPKLPSDATASDVMKALLQRSGVLREPIENKIDFVHNAFKEYLCAKAVAAGDKLGFLSKQIEHDAWREIGVLAPAISDETRRNEFIGTILAEGDNTPEKRSIYHLLAVGCLETCTELKYELQSEIRRRIAHLRPPESMAEAKSLSAARDFALPLLRSSINQSARGAAACIRTLRLINTPSALDCLESYGDDRRVTVVQELMATWPFFDRTEYARRVLAHTQGIGGRLDIEVYPKLEGLRFLTKISYLVLRGFRQSVDIAAFQELSYLVGMRRLIINCRTDFDLSVLAAMSNLMELRLSCSGIYGHEHLSKIASLRTLDVTSDSTFDLTPASAIAELRELRIHTRADIVGIENISALKKLKILELSPAIDGSRANALEYLPTLSELEGLKVGFENANNINYLSALSKLKHLVLFLKQEHADISALSSCKELRHLSINGQSHISDIGFLRNMPNLEGLYFARCHLPEDLSVLCQLPKLRELSIYYTDKLHDYSFLKDLPNLERLWVSRDVIQIVEALGLKAKVRYGFPSRQTGIQRAYMIR